MIRRRYGLAVMWACLMTTGLVYAGDQAGHHRERQPSPLGMVYSPNAFKADN
jgi:hypothetical protein